MKILVPLGTRPEIIKLAPVVAALRGARFAVTVVATGQHYDASLTDAFFAELELAPDIRWDLEGSESGRLGQMLERSIDVVADVSPDTVLMLGDTNTVPLFALAARRAQVPVVHVEAGLRSFNPTSLEEVNRQVAGVLASLHFAPTELARRFLQAEGVDPRRIQVVGNPLIDVLRQTGMGPSPLADRAGVVVTAHRATNVDDPARLAQLVELVRALAADIGPVAFPVHPRTRRRLDDAGLASQLAVADIELLEPLSWTDMLDRLARCRLVVTDSGGLQEEASYFRVPVVVLRRSTPRWEGVQVGSAVLTGLDVAAALGAARRLVDPVEQRRIAAIPCLYGDGFASERIVEALGDPDTQHLLELREPDLVEGVPVL